MKLKNYTAIVTGSTSGIGKAIALRLASMGASVVVTGRDETRLRDVCLECRQFCAENQKIVGIRADLLLDSDVINLCNKLWQHFGQKLDILVNNAGIYSLTGFTSDNYMKSFDEEMGLLRAQQLLTKLLVPSIVETRGCIINVSARTITPFYESFAYTITKNSIDLLTKSLAIELKNKGIRITCISPGMLPTPMVTETPELNEMLESTELLDSFALKRIGTMDEVVDGIIFIVTNGAVNSIKLHIDGTPE